MSILGNWCLAVKQNSEEDTLTQKASENSQEHRKPNDRCFWPYIDISILLTFLFFAVLYGGHSLWERTSRKIYIPHKPTLLVPTGARVTPTARATSSRGPELTNNWDFQIHLGASKWFHSGPHAWIWSLRPTDHSRPPKRFLGAVGSPRAPVGQSNCRSWRI